MNPVRLALCAVVVAVAVKSPDVFARSSHAVEPGTLRVGLISVAVLVVFGSARARRSRR